VVLRWPRHYIVAARRSSRSSGSSWLAMPTAPLLRSNSSGGEESVTEGRGMTRKGCALCQLWDASTPVSDTLSPSERGVKGAVLAPLSISVYVSMCVCGSGRESCGVFIRRCRYTWSAVFFFFQPTERKRKANKMKWKTASISWRRRFVSVLKGRVDRVLDEASAAPPTLLLSFFSACYCC
jgi:hypothetical protein